MYVIPKLRLNSQCKQVILPRKCDLFRAGRITNNAKYSEDANFEDPVEYRRLSKTEMFEAGQAAFKEEFGNHVRSQAEEMLKQSQSEKPAQ